MKTIAPQKLPTRSRADIETLFKFTKAASDSFRKGDAVIHITIQETGELITLPKSALQMLSGLLQAQTEHGLVTMLPSESEIGTQRAADLLNVSRPHVVKLLEDGEIPFKKVGTHRRILLKDLVDFRAKLDLKRQLSLQRLADQAQDLDLGY